MTLSFTTRGAMGVVSPARTSATWVFQTSFPVAVSIATV